MLVRPHKPGRRPPRAASAPDPRKCPRHSTRTRRSGSSSICNVRMRTGDSWCMPAECDLKANGDLGKVFVSSEEGEEALTWGGCRLSRGSHGAVPSSAHAPSRRVGRGRGSGSGSQSRGRPGRLDGRSRTSRHWLAHSPQKLSESESIREKRLLAYRIELDGEQCGTSDRGLLGCGGPSPVQHLLHHLEGRDPRLQCLHAPAERTQPGEAQAEVKKELGGRDSDHQRPTCTRRLRKRSCSRSSRWAT